MLTCVVFVVGVMIALLLFGQKDEQVAARASVLKSRTQISAAQLQADYLPDVPLVVLERLLAIVEDQFAEDPRLVRPQDEYFEIYHEFDCSSFVDAIEREFGCQTSEWATAANDGSFGSIARCCAER